MDTAIWLRLEAVQQFLTAIDWNRILGRCDLPRDIVRIVFDMAFGHGFQEYYAWSIERARAKLEKIESTLVRYGHNAQVHKKMHGKSKRAGYRLRRIEEVVARFGRYSEVLADLDSPRNQFDYRPYGMYVFDR